MTLSEKSNNMEKDEICYQVAKAIYEKEKASGYKRNGIATLTIEGYGEVSADYEYFELEGYEEPCYDVESSRCGPGGFYGLEAYIVTVRLCDGDGNDVDAGIDNMEVSCCFTEDMTETSDKFDMIADYFENNPF